jgi:N-methylhydantoinase A
MSFRLGVDIGGTFTDFALLDESNARMTLHKMLTTADDPARAVLEGTKEILARDGVGIMDLSSIVHGTTLITNAVIERRGARVGMLATQGFRDVLDIAKEQRYEATDLRLKFPKPVVPRPLRLELNERTLPGGRIEMPSDVAVARNLVRRLVEESNVEAIAVCFLHSYANPANEQAVAALIQREFPSVFLSISSEVAPFMREYERWTTTTVNAYAQPLVDRYLRALDSGLRQIGFKGNLFVMTSNGGTATVDVARRFPVRLIESGPVAGALMSALHSRTLGMPNVLSFDMGGTTAKGTIIHQHQPLKRDMLEIAHVYGFKKGSGLPLKIPVIDMIEIGAGGGGIARADSRGVIAVGPRSAGAKPGPACYGLGGADPTLTDANLALGYLDARFFLGGKMVLNESSARRALEQTIAKPLDLPPLRAAWGIHETINEDVARAFRVHASQRGFDYRTCSMVAFGGSGPIHAARIARKLHIPQVIFPPGAGVMSAFGLLASPPNHEIIRTERIPYAELTPGSFAEKFERLESEAAAYLQGAGLSRSAISATRRLDMRYVGQGYEIEVSVPGDLPIEEAFRRLPGLFEENYARVFSTTFGGRPLEVVNWKAEVSGPTPQIGRDGYRIQGFGDTARPAPQKGERSAYVPERNDMCRCPVYDRYALRPQMSFVGPALVEENESTCVIGEGDHVVVDAQYNLIATTVTALESRK